MNFSGESVINSN